MPDDRRTPLWIALVVVEFPKGDLLSSNELGIGKVDDVDMGGLLKLSLLVTVDMIPPPEVANEVAVVPGDDDVDEAGVAVRGGHPIGEEESPRGEEDGDLRGFSDLGDLGKRPVRIGFFSDKESLLLLGEFGPETEVPAVCSERIAIASQSFKSLLSDADPDSTISAEGSFLSLLSSAEVLLAAGELSPCSCCSPTCFFLSNAAASQVPTRMLYCS